MVARAPALFDPLVSDWRTRLAALRQPRPGPAEDPARLYMKTRVLRFMLAQYSNPLLRYAKPLDLVSSIPTTINLHPELAVLLQKVDPPSPPAPAAVAPPAPEAPTAVPQAPPIPPPAPVATAPQTGLIIYGPIPRSLRQDFITILAFDLGWPATRATAIANLINKKSASFIATSPLIADRLRRHLLPYQIKSEIYPPPR